MGSKVAALLMCSAFFAPMTVSAGETASQAMFDLVHCAECQPPAPPKPNFSQETLPQSIHIPVTVWDVFSKDWKTGNEKVSSGVCPAKVRKAYLGIKYGPSMVHAFTVFVFDDGGFSARDGRRSQALVVTLGNLSINGTRRLKVVWDLLSFEAYAKIAVMEKKDRVYLFPYELPRGVTAVMLANALALAEQKSFSMEHFNLFTNNCIMDALEIINSVRPEDQQLHGLIPQLTAWLLQRKGVVGDPVELRGEELLRVDFDALAR